MGEPVAYPLCDRTVTVYRLQDGGVTRRVAEGCFYRWEDALSEDGQGVGFRRKFLLIQPGEKEIYPGDKIFDGVGPEVTADMWEEFSPAAVPGLSVAAYATPWYWAGRLCHTEAGWK